MKKVVSALAALTMLLTFTACTDDSDAGNKPAETTAPASDSEKPADKDEEEEKPADGEKTTLNIYAFTDEVPGMVKKYCEMNPDFAAKYEIKETIVPTTDGLYQPALDQALLGGGKDAPDMYAAEAAFVLKYTQGDMAKYAAAYDDLGIDTAAKIAEAEIAQYSVDIGTNGDGKVVGLGYQATGGAFIYRRSIAKDAFGTDDPATIKSEIGPGWDKFFEAAEKLKAKGYGIVSGDGDMWHAVENSSESGWVDGNKLVIDAKREAFLDQSMQLMENNYHNNTQDWQEGWFSDMKGEGEKGIFGFFGPAWLINYTMGDNCGDDKATAEREGTWGDWAVCEPPVGFFWGGTWVLGNKDSANKEAVGDIIEWITLDTSETGLQYMWANGTYNDAGTKDSVASNVVMKKSNGEIDFLAGQNMFDVFVPANEFANGKNLTQYDESINSLWRDQVRQYTSGQKSREDALKDFKQAVADELGLDT